MSYAAYKSLNIMSDKYNCLMNISYKEDDHNIMSGDKEDGTQRS